MFALFLFGPGRQTALQSVKAVQYDPYRCKYEKRLTRYLSYLWKCRANKGEFLQPYPTVERLCEAIGLPIESRRLTVARDRFEKCVERLKADGVISAFEYARWGDNISWHQWTAKIEPPDAIKDHYLKHYDKNTPTEKRKVRDESKLSIGERLRAKRQEMRLSQIVCADRIGITQASLSNVESGRVNPSKTIVAKIEKWLNSQI
jgi:DNA-binding XRE family transcriptional regulator